MDAVLQDSLTALTAIGLLAGPPAAASVALHAIERRMAHALAGLAGRRAVLLTGWLGVPVHELSHVLMCLVFRHRIERVALFRPDPRTGTLGYVDHSWDRRSPWQVVGAFFVGIAPLLGGSAAILGLLGLLVPGALVLPAAPAIGLLRDGAWAAVAVELSRPVEATALAVAERALCGDWRPWAFLYAAFCIGSHISPSPQDLRGGLVGALACFAALFLLGFAAAAAGTADAMPRAAIGAGVAVGAVLLFVAALNLPLAICVGLLAGLRWR